MNKDGKILNYIAQALFDKKAINILALDVRPCVDSVDYVVIAEGMADTHVKVLAREVISAMYKAQVPLSYEEGLKNGDWIVLDFSWVVVHLFMPGMRETYELENLWAEAQIVDLTIDVSSKVRGGSLRAVSCW